MGLEKPVVGDALEAFLADALGETAAEIVGFAKLDGGAVQENWALDVRLPDGGTTELVLRTDAPSGVAASHSRAHEFALLRAAHEAGVTVPRPIAVCEDPSVFGKPFYVMGRIHGIAAGHILTREDKWPGDRVALAERLGEELAKIHAIRPPRPDLGFLVRPEGAPAQALIDEYRGWLDGYRDPRPAMEWSLSWLEDHAPPAGELVLCHRDYRTGNYMVADDGLSGILDWEFAGWGDAMEDVGWFCARCWRFAEPGREAGGIAAREDFYRGYERAGGAVDREAVFYWEVMAHIRWAVIALLQGERHVSGEEPSLDLALTGRIVAELELELLRMTAPEGRD